MATNKFPTHCSEHWCNLMLFAGEGVLRRHNEHWQVYCPEHAAMQSRTLRDGHNELTTSDPLAVFLFERMEDELEGTSGFGGLWFHQPANSGRVINELREVECQGLRTTADHLVTWQPMKAHKNVGARSLILTLYVEAPEGSRSRYGLELAMRALAMAYMDHPEYQAAWTLTER